MKHKRVIRNWLKLEENYRLVQILIGIFTVIVLGFGIYIGYMIKLDLKELNVERLRVEKDGYGLEIIPGPTSTIQGFGPEE